MRRAACSVQLRESDWMVVGWLDYFSERAALRTSAAHRTERLDAAGCSCTIYTSVTEGGDKQSQTHPLSFPSLVSPFSFTLHLTLSFSGKGANVSSELPALLPRVLFFSLSLCSICRGPLDTFICRCAFRVLPHLNHYVFS